MQRLMVPVQLRFERAHTGRNGGPLVAQRRRPARLGGSHPVDLLPERAYDGLAVFVDVDHREEALAEALCFEPLLYNPQRRLLLADDENRLAPTDAVRNDIHDGLA